MDKPPKLCEYDKMGDLDYHIQLVNNRMNYFSVDEASKYKISVLTLVGLDRICFNGIPDRSIEF